MIGFLDVLDDSRIVRSRPLRTEDARAVAMLANTVHDALSRRRSHFEARDVEMWWLGCDFEHDSWFVEADGEALAAGWLAPDGQAAGATVIVAQAGRERDLVNSLYDRCEASVRKRQAAKIYTWVFPEDDESRVHLLGRGFQEVRRYSEMVIEFDSEPPAPTLADPLALEPFRQELAPAFHAATSEAFADLVEWHETPFEEWWDRWGSQQDDEVGPLWFLVRDGDEIAAVVRNEMRENGGYVGILGVRRPWRGRGLAKALLHQSFNEFWRRGARRASVGVDAQSGTNAPKLYESVGMRIENSIAVYEKPLA